MPTNKLLFNNKTLEDLKPAPKGKRQYYYDKKVEGLGLSVTDAGGKTFIVYRWVGGEPWRMTIGKFNAEATQVEEHQEEFKTNPVAFIKKNQKDVRLTAEQARTVARDVVAALERGEDPKKERQDAQGELNFEKLFTLYMEQYAKLHTKTWQETQHCYRRYFQIWSNKVLSTITQRDIENWLNDLAKTKGKHTANRNYDTMRAVISWGIRKRLLTISQNPCVGVDRFKTQHRERFVLPGDEYQRLADAINKEKESFLRDFFWMCLFTGARKSNVMAMRWEQINEDLQTWTIRGSEMKNDDSQTITLTTDAMALLRERKVGDDKDPVWVFPSDSSSGHLVSPKTAWKRIIERAGIKDLRIHDLRRTVGSYMAIQGVSPTIIGKALGHRSTQATAIYARLTQDPVRQALQSVQTALSDPTKLVSPKKQNVVPLKQTGK